MTDAFEPRSRLVLGLGNPPGQYAGTRHNVGADVVDRVAARMGIRTWLHRWRSLSADGHVGGCKVTLVKPMTYMNRSGLAARAALQQLGLLPNELLVLADDVNLELGRLRLRRKGSAGGHLGLESVAEHLGTTDFPRLRIGVGGPVTRAHLVEHVLSPLSDEELELLSPRLDEAADAVYDCVRVGIGHAMNAHNR